VGEDPPLAGRGRWSSVWINQPRAVTRWHPPLAPPAGEVSAGPTRVSPVPSRSSPSRAVAPGGRRDWPGGS